MKKTIGIAAVTLTLAACASSSDSLQRETARFIGGVPPEAVTVLNVDRGLMSVKWEARTKDGRVYRCDADDMVRRVHCVEQ